MLQLENKGKLKRVIGNNSSPIKSWMNWEDPLVALVFGFAAYLPVDILLGPILERADRIGNSQPFQLKVNDNDIDDVELWPSIKSLQKDYPSLANLDSEKGGELDALWCFKTFNLIIEAKTIGGSFDRDQLNRYIEAFTKDVSKPLWVLTVGKGITAVKSLISFKVPKDVNLLFIDWASIHGIITKQVEDKQLIKEAYIRRCLKDLSISLNNRNLKPFDGFFCQDKNLRLQSDKKIQETVQENWFPRSLWYILPETLSTIKMEFRQWLTRPFWVLDQTNNIRFSPIPWLTK